MWYNRRNLVSKGLKWDDIRDMNSTLKALEVQKTKIWPRPDYAELVSGGMNPLTAHLVKQVYDSIATKPSVGHAAPTDAQMEAYVGEVARIKEAVYSWAKDIGAQKGLLEGLMESAKARMGGTSLISRFGIGASNEVLLDALYPKNEKGARWGRENQIQNDLVNLVGGDKLTNALQVNTESARTAVKALNQGWPAPQEAWEKRFSIHEVPAGAEIWSSTKGKYKVEKPYFEIKVRAQRGMMVRGEFPTREAAVARAKELAAKKPDTRRMAEAALTEFERKGPPQRPGGLDVTPKALQEKFGFRGINYGNYTDQGERQVFTNNAYDSLLDLADVVGLSAAAISLNGTLGLAYGAQGRGGKYAAHFVPGVNEINLTKDAGAGSLAHEWWHAIDHYFAVQAGESYAKGQDPYLTHIIERGMWDIKNASPLRAQGALAGLRPEIRQAFLDIVESMKKVQETPEQVAARIESIRTMAAKRLEQWLKHFRDRLETHGTMVYEGGRSVKKTLDAKEAAVRANHIAQFDLIADALRRGDVGAGWEKIGTGQLSAVRTNVGEIRRLYKDVTGHVPSPDEIKALDSAAASLKGRLDAKYAAEDQKAQSVESQYSKDARGLDGPKKSGKEYWSRETELGARAFQSYILDRLEKQARRNDYLTRPQGSREDYKESGGDPYPRGAEREKINAAFDVLVNSLKTKETESGTMVFDEAYHGSPHEFGEFSLSKVGTGEGNQSYGWGLYFAGAKDVAEYYKSKLSMDEYYVNGEKSTGIERTAAHMWEIWSGRANRIEIELKSDRMSRADKDAIVALVNKWQAGGVSIEKRGGHLYHVEIPPADTYLDWDKPLSAQSEGVRAILVPIAKELGLMGADFSVEKRGRDFVVVSGNNEYSRFRTKEKADAEVARLSDAHEPTGELVYRTMKNHPEVERLANELKGKYSRPGDRELAQASSEHLLALGIPGIKYDDQWSRGKYDIRDGVGDEAGKRVVVDARSREAVKTFDTLAQARAFIDGKKTSNFVVFDDKQVQITRVSDEEAKAYGPGVDMVTVKKQVQLELDFGGSGEVAKEFKETGKVDYIGKSMETWQDAAEIVSSMRHTRLEHLHIILAKDGRVVGHRVITSGLPNAVMLTDAQFREVMAQADALGADAIYDGHNHPSGNPTPSEADGKYTKNMRLRAGSRYRGSVVTDHDEFSVINPNKGGGARAISRLKFDVPKEMYQDQKAPQLLSENEVVAEAFKSGFDGDSHTVIYLDTKRRVMAVEHIAADADLPSMVKAGIVRNKSAAAAVVTPKPKYGVQDLPNQVTRMIHVDDEGNSRDLWGQRASGHSAYGRYVTSSFVQDADEPMPRYMGGEGMSPEDFAKAIAEEKIVPGSPVTLRVKLEGMPKGTPGKVLAVGQSTQTLMVKFEGETVPRAVRAENLSETNRKPAARSAVEQARKDARLSGKPSQPIKRTVTEGQAGLARPPKTVTEPTALKGALEAEARGAKAADAVARKEMRAKLRAQERAARGELTAAQKNLRHAVLEAQMSGKWEAATRAKVVEFAKAFLPPSERGALLSKVADAKTNNDLLEAFSYIDQKANAYANKKAMADVRVLVERVQRSKTFPIGIKLQIEELISDIRLENWSEATLDKIAAQQALIVHARATGAEVDVPQALLDQIAKLTKRPLAELDGVEVADILADLRFLVERGREVRAMQGELKELDREEALADLVAGTKKVYVKPTTAKGVKRPFGGPALAWADEAKNKWLGRADMAQAAGIYLRPVQAIMDDLDGTFLGGGPNRREWERLQSAYIDAKTYAMRKKEAFAEALRKIGPIDQQELDRVWIVGFREMKDVRPHLHKMGLGDDEIDAVKLTPKEQMLLDAMRAPFRGQEELSTLTMVAAVLNNSEFVQVENYLPIKTKYVPSNPNTSAKEILANEVAMRRKSPERGMLIERVSGAAREFRTDLGVIESAIEGQAALMHMAIPLLRAHSIFTDPAYEAAAGDAAVDFWRDYIDVLARDGAFPKSKVERVLAKAMSNLGVAALAFKPNVALMQLSSLGPGSTIVGGGFVRRAIFADAEWDGFVDEHMPLVKGRQGGDPAVRDVMHGGLLPKVAEAGFKPMVAGDHWTAKQVALGAYFQFMERAGLPADPRKPHPPALRYAQSVAGRTMASPWLVDMPLALSRGGVVVKSALQFQGETLAKFALMKDLAADTTENPGRSSASAGYLGAALLYEAGVRWGWRTFVMTALFAIGAIEKKQFDRFMDKDNGYWKQVVASAANGIPFVGAVADAIMYDAGPIPVVNTSVDALAGIGNGVMGAIEGKPIKSMKALVQGLTALASIVGTPGAGVVGWIAKQPLRGMSDKKSKKGVYN